MSNNTAQLVLVSTSGNSAVLRSDAGIRYHVVNTPVSVLTVPAYVDYTVEFPSVEMTDTDGTTRDVSEYLSCNHPNPELPGLYRLSFMLSLPGDAPVEIWASYVSIEEPPLLRGAVSPWMRENRTVSDLSRIVMEPQFQEALYAVRSPMYNFMVSNTPKCVSAASLPRFKGIQGYALTKAIFLSTQQLPAGTEIRSGDYTFTLKTPKLAPDYVPGVHYGKYDVVRYTGTYWLALDDTDTIPSEDGWLQGYPYEVSEESIPEAGNIPVDSVLVTADAGGYLFRVDALSGITIGHYWGMYDPNSFYDYQVGDLVSVVSENVYYLYRRNDTDTSQKEIELSYKPGNYRNPHWDEVYCASPQGMLRDPVITPVTNASNSIVSKTGSVMDGVFRIYSRLAGIPMELVDALGLKKGVLIWALLYRTRNTYYGLKTALQALGMSITSLERVHPSIKYTSGGTEITDVYDEIGKCKDMAKSIKAGRLLMSRYDLPTPLPADAAAIPYIHYRDGGTVERYVPGTGWTDYYEFEKLSGDFDPSEWDFSKNNRYYEATVAFLDRIAGDNLIDMGDGEEWLSDEAFAPISSQLDTLFAYEIPIYIYLRMKVRLASVGTMAHVGTMGGVVYHDAYGGDVEMRVYPSKMFDVVSLATKEYWPVVSVSDTENGTYAVADYDMSSLLDFRRYRFDHNVYVKFALPDGPMATGYWVSPYAIGRLVSMSEPLFLCNGEVGVTVEVSDTSSLTVTVSAYIWNYIFGNDGSPWETDEEDYEIPFAGYREIPSTFISEWHGTALAFTNYIDKVTSPQGNIYPSEPPDLVPVVSDLVTQETISDSTVISDLVTSDGDTLYAFEGNDLYLSGTIPEVIYFWHGEVIIGTLYLGEIPYMTEAPEGEPNIKISFTGIFA